jgi:hypothetical protein
VKGRVVTVKVCQMENKGVLCDSGGAMISGEYQYRESVAQEIDRERIDTSHDMRVRRVCAEASAAECGGASGGSSEIQGTASKSRRRTSTRPQDCLVLLLMSGQAARKILGHPLLVRASLPPRGR